MPLLHGLLIQASHTGFSHQPFSKSLRKPICQNGLANCRCKTNKLRNIVNREQRIGQQFLGVDEMAKVGTSKVLAGVAGTVGIKRAEVSAKTSVL